MITIRFTQCDPQLRESWDCVEAAKWPVIPRLKLYENLLTYDGEQFVTYDELLILLAQKWHREGKAKVRFESICSCSGTRGVISIELDEQGDMLQDPHHGFFPQRLPLLR